MKVTKAPPATRPDSAKRAWLPRREFLANLAAAKADNADQSHSPSPRGRRTRLSRPEVEVLAPPLAATGPILRIRCARKLKNENDPAAWRLFGCFQIYECECDGRSPFLENAIFVLREA